jgi:hypothetical protein
VASRYLREAEPIVIPFRIDSVMASHAPGRR